MPEAQKVEALNNALAQITKLTLDAIQHSVAAIRTPQGVVTDQDHIREFLQNCDRKLFNEIRDRAIKLRTTCPECGHEYEQTITLDNVSFFEVAS